MGDREAAKDESIAKQIVVTLATISYIEISTKHRQISGYVGLAL